MINQLTELVTSMRNEFMCTRIKCLKDDGRTLEMIEVITE